MKPTIRVLHLEDSPRDAELLHDQLKAGGVSADIVRVDSKERFEAALAGDAFDVILCDYNLPGYDGLAAVKLAQEKQPAIPVIIVSGTVGEEEAVRSLHVGATDYLLKQRLDRLAPAVRRAMQEAEERRHRQQAEEALRRHQQQLASIYETVADVIFYVEVEQDGGYRFLSVNRAFLSTTGLDPRHVVGKRLDEILPEPSLTLVLEKYGEAIREKKVVRWEETSDYPTGRLIGDVSVAPVFDHAGNCTHLVGSVHDITERKRLEDQFRQAQKMESVGQLAGGIAHDFNNLLTAIIGYSELLLDRIADQVDVAADLGEIKRAGERASQLTKQLLAFSRKQTITPRIVDLNRVVGDLQSMLRRVIGEDIVLEMNTAPSLGRTKADPSQVQQVLMNLVVNARDAMPRGGRLTIGTADVVLNAAFVRDHAGAALGRYVSLTVADTGQGMTPEVRARVFEPFFTTKPVGRGTGLGLSTVYGIVKQHGGYITVDSAPGTGTTFVIYWPYVDEPAEPLSQGRAVESGLRGTETVLVVEDEAGIRALVGKMLERYGYQVMLAQHAEDALALDERHGGPIHLLLTDIVMPGLNGPDLAQRLVGRRPTMKVLYMSGFAPHVTISAGSLSDRAAFLQKPFAADTLATKVRECLDHHPKAPRPEAASP